jgi:hypothetical protein
MIPKNGVFVNCSEAKTTVLAAYAFNVLSHDEEFEQ